MRHPPSVPVGQVELVVMDMAGTTVHDGGEVPAAFRAALAAHGIALSDDEVARVRGASKREVIGRLVQASARRAGRGGGCGVRRIPRGAGGALPRRRARGEGRGGVFGWLRARGVRVALNTGFDRGIVDLLLDALGWSDGVVDAVVCGDEVRQGRPAPYLVFRAMEAVGVTDVRRVMCVGDTELDLRAGWNAGAGWIVGVLGGAHPRERLEQAPHTHLLPSVASLPELW